MRSSLPTALLSLLPAFAAASSPSQCVQSKAKELAVNAACGDKMNMLACFQKVSSDSGLEDSIYNCLTKAGCTDKSAATEARFLITFCDGEPDELKKRRPEGLIPRASDSTADSTEATTTTSSSSSSTTTTTSDSTTSTTSTSTSSASTVSSTTSTSTSGSTSSTSTAIVTRADETTSTSLQCSTETQTMVKVCDSTNTKSCSTVTSTTSVCAAANFCTTDTSGNNLCMLRQDGMNLSGSIVAVFLAVVLTGIIGSIIFLCCQDRKEQKKMKARAEAAAIAKTNISSSVRPEGRSVSANRPAGEANPFAG